MLMKKLTPDHLEISNFVSLALLTVAYFEMQIIFTASFQLSKNKFSILTAFLFNFFKYDF